MVEAGVPNVEVDPKGSADVLGLIAEVVYLNR